MDDETFTKREKLKNHLKENKKMYIMAPIVFGAGYFMRPQVVNVVDAFNIKYKSPTTTNVITVLERCACPEPIPVLDKLTGESYRSITRAAKVTGKTAAEISKDLHGVVERFEKLPNSVFA